MRTDIPTGGPAWNLGQALTTMEHADIDRLPVVDNEGIFVGVVSTGQILKLDEILEQTED